MLAIFLFYNKAQGKQDRYALSKHFRHVDVITYQGDQWLAFRFGKEGITYKPSRFKSGLQVLKHVNALPHVIAILTVDINKRCEFRWLPLWGRTCNELARYLTGMDLGVTYSPRHFYSKLIKYDNRRNYQILNAWRRRDGILGRQQ